MKDSKRIKKLYKLVKQLTKLEKGFPLNIYNEIVLEKQVLKSKRRKAMIKIKKIDKKISKISKILILFQRLGYSLLS